MKEWAMAEKKKRVFVQGLDKQYQPRREHEGDGQFHSNIDMDSSDKVAQAKIRKMEDAINRMNKSLKSSLDY
jgi:hypothetical protein